MAKKHVSRNAIADTVLAGGVDYDALKAYQKSYEAVSKLMSEGTSKAAEGKSLMRNEKVVAYKTAIRESHKLGPILAEVSAGGSGDMKKLDGHSIDAIQQAYDKFWQAERTLGETTEKAEGS